MTCKKALLLSSCLLSFLWGSTAIADDSDWDRGLRGKFRMAGNSSCTESILGFSGVPPFFTNGASTSYHEVFTGTSNFDGRGRLTQSVKGTTVFDGPIGSGNAAVGTFIADCDFTYKMTGELSFSFTGKCRAGSVLVEGISAEGVISRDGDVILISVVDPEIETISVGGNEVAKRYCISTVTLIRAPRRH